MFARRPCGQHAEPTIPRRDFLAKTFIPFSTREVVPFLMIITTVILFPGTTQQFGEVAAIEARPGNKMALAVEMRTILENVAQVRLKQ